jgi:hypothetical protein
VPCQLRNETLRYDARVTALVAVLALFAGVGLVLFLARRELTVFHLVAERGQIRRARGRMPPEMMHDLRDVLARAKASGTVTGRIEDRRVALHFGGGIDEATAQRLRNVAGRFPTARIRQSKRIR